MTGHRTNNGNLDNQARATVVLAANPERHLIRPSGSRRHVEFTIKVHQAPQQRKTERLPLNLALVVDRSGSMAGAKLPTAKAAALAVVDKLDERDRVAVIVFDNKVDVIHDAAAVTASTKAHIRAELSRIQARGTTALHEGWLIGCKTIASDEPAEPHARLSRCFLLTDGQANVGLTEPERIAAEAAGIREHAGIGTSTFGIGADYAEELLGPMAVAGGGQFHHLRSPEEIAQTFVGELNDLLEVAARNVRLELESESLLTVEVISEFWATPAKPGEAPLTVTIGDLLDGDEKHVVVRFGFPAAQGISGHAIRARVVWDEDAGTRRTEWQDVMFTYADHAECNAEPRDMAVMHWVGLHHAERTKLRAVDLSRQGKREMAQDLLQTAAAHIARYAGNDVELRNAIQELRRLAEELSYREFGSMERKAMMFESARLSRMQKDFRQSSRFEH